MSSDGMEGVDDSSEGKSQVAVVLNGELSGTTDGAKRKVKSSMATRPSRPAVARRMSGLLDG